MIASSASHTALRGVAIVERRAHVISSQIDPARIGNRGE
jgi:hypothetical protein